MSAVQGQGPLDITEILKTIVGIGTFAISCINNVKGLRKKGEAERYVKEIEKMQHNIRILGLSIVSYRMLNLHITQVNDDIRDMAERFHVYKEEKIKAKSLPKMLRKDLDKTINYFKQNLGCFNTDALDRSQVSQIRDQLDRVENLLTSAHTNLDNGRIDKFFEDNTGLSKECNHIRGMTYFAIDKLGEEFSKL